MYERMICPGSDRCKKEGCPHEGKHTETSSCSNICHIGGMIGTKRCQLVKKEVEMENSSSNELKVQKEKVLEAMSNCPESRKVLVTLFPEVEREEKEINFSELGTTIVLKEGLDWPQDFSDVCIEVRTAGQFARKGFFLSNFLDWKLLRDDCGQWVLVPTRKQV